MDDKFFFGVALGMLGGALVVANSNKARQAVKNSEQQITEKLGQSLKKTKQKTSK